MTSTIRLKVVPDKVRIIDAAAEHQDCRIHAVEISDQRSFNHFVTVFTKKRFPDYEELHSGHNPELYHREGKPTKWVFEYWKPTEQQPFSGWGAHYHLLCYAEPTYESFGVFLPDMSEHLRQAIRDYVDSR